MLANSCLIFLLLAATNAFDVELYEPPPLAPRETWNGRPPARPLPNNTLPLEAVVILHTGGEECHTPGECMMRVLHTQTFHMDALNLDDIPYNFLVGGDGTVYVGRGWYKEGEHTPDHNRGTIGVALVGDFTEEQPSSAQLDALKKLMDMGMNLNLLPSDFTIVGQCQLVSSNSPGLGVLKLLPRFSHFNGSPPETCTGFNPVFPGLP